MALFVDLRSIKFQQTVFFSLLLAVLNTSHTVNGIPLGNFYPFGDAAAAIGETDSVLRPNDDGSSLPISMSRVFPFFGSDHFVVFVNNNGVISFTTAVSTYTPQPFPLGSGGNHSNFLESFQLISPFWGDVDTTGTGKVWYRESFNSDLVARAQNEIRAAFPVVAQTFSPSFLFIATWDHVGYYSSHDDKTNTFQCVMVTDGFQSFIIFLYADGLIQWTTGDASDGMNGLGGTPAQVGFNAGDGERFFVVEGSRTSDVINIATKSNVDIPGMFVFQVDGFEGPGDCDPDGDAELTLAPRRGNVLGGTPVLISGQCIDREKQYSCRFDGKKVRGFYYNERTVLCVSPIMSTIGRVVVELREDVKDVDTNETIRLSSFGSFQTVSPERAHQIQFEDMDATEDNQLLFKPSDQIHVTWVPEELLPPYLTSGADQVNVDIEIYEESGDLDWKSIKQLAQNNAPNSGSVEITIPSEITGLDCKSELSVAHVCPIAIRVSITMDTLISTTEGEAIDNSFFRGANRIGIWSGIAFVQSNRAVNEPQFSMVCNKWANPDPTDPEDTKRITPEEIWSRLPPCPPLLRQAKLDTNFELEEMDSLFGSNSTKYREQSMKFFHPNLMECYRQRTPDTTLQSEKSFGQQCCYNAAGSLITGQPGGGSGDKMSPVVNYNQHVLTDLLPYVYCCKGGLQCNMYYKQRPSSDFAMEEYSFPFPALLFGDPHISTLDGFKYTFNGQGEFFLIETHDKSFTLQGRMLPASDATGANALGTVFTAIVAKDEATDSTVEFQINQRESLDILVNKRRIDFRVISEQDFGNVTVKDTGNNTSLAEFRNGVSIEVRVANAMISAVRVILPARYQRMTQGLLGTFNGVTQDDLLPRGMDEPLSPDASMEEIFDEFGMTWIVASEEESRFAYNKPGESWLFYFRDHFSFRPVFDTVFDNPDLEEEAIERCGSDTFCLFDVATTKRIEVGVSTMEESHSVDEEIELAIPIVCDPPCVNGVCIGTNNCSCSEGFSGPTCSEEVLFECEENMCQNNATCVLHVRTFTCECPPGFIGTFCELKEPPFDIAFINSSPRVSEDSVKVDFTSNKPIESAKCFLSKLDEDDCSKGYVTFSDVPPGSYVLRIVVKAANGERVVKRRQVHVGRAEEVCAVHLINKGLSLQRDNAVIEFRGTQAVTSYLCRMDDGPFEYCQSPAIFYNLEVGVHRFQVLPQCVGDGSTLGDVDDYKRLSVRFSVS